MMAAAATTTASSTFLLRRCRHHGTVILSSSSSPPAASTSSASYHSSLSRLRHRHPSSTTKSVSSSSRHRPTANSTQLPSASSTPTPSSRISNNSTFDKIVKHSFPGAITNSTLVSLLQSTLSQKHNFTSNNTLLATSLCCDELARELEDDLVAIYGHNFNLGGLAGFPFAGKTGFGAMAAHIPDGGYCLLVHGPHVGICQNGMVGRVERRGIALVDYCCGSAIAASNYLRGITHGEKNMEITAKIQEFSDFQQSAVRELILPFGRRLSDAELGISFFEDNSPTTTNNHHHNNHEDHHHLHHQTHGNGIPGGQGRMIALPYALYDSQKVLINDILNKCGPGNIKGGLALLGGIQINTSPESEDFFHPLRFDYFDSSGRCVESMLDSIVHGAALLSSSSSSSSSSSADE
ncbi:hypothetical protein ACHAXH_001092 [Discostella pseudostelligera]